MEAEVERRRVDEFLAERRREMVAEGFSPGQVRELLVESRRNLMDELR